jgi:heme oxygenase
MGNRKMETLKELTKEQHKNAEKCAFVKKLLKKELTPEQYYTYLSNQAVVYWFLEDFANQQGLFDDIEVMKRSSRMLEDLTSIRREYGFGYPNNLPTTDRYVSYLRTNQKDKDLLLSHIYVRHLGDLSGGQIIKRFVPVRHTKHYDFDGNTENIKEKFKEKVTPKHALEANVCFDFVIDFFHDLEKHFGF